MSRAPQRIQVQPIPILPKPSLLPDPIRPSLVDALPQPITLTYEDVRYYMDVCEDWRSGEYTVMEMKNKYTTGYLSRGTSCDWAINGYDVQADISFDIMLNSLIDYTLRLEAHIKFLTETVMNTYEASVRAESNRD